MSKYSKSQLIELAKGVFKGSPGLSVLYADGAGTFNNEEQYARKSEKEREGLIKITRAMCEGKDEADYQAAAKKAEKEAAEKAKAEAAAKKAAEAAAKKEAAEKAKAEAAAKKAKE